MVDWYPGGWKQIEQDAQMALEMTGEALRTDLLAQQTVPFAEASEENLKRGVVPGELQGSIYVDRSHSGYGTVSVVSNTPYARRLYFHPEYNFYKGTNPRAGGEWYEPYKPGGKRNKWLVGAYVAFLKKLRNK